MSSSSSPSYTPGLPLDLVRLVAQAGAGTGVDRDERELARALSLVCRDFHGVGQAGALDPSTLVEAAVGISKGSLGGASWISSPKWTSLLTLTLGLTYSSLHTGLPVASTLFSRHPTLDAEFDTFVRRLPPYLRILHLDFEPPYHPTRFFLRSGTPTTFQKLIAYAGVISYVFTRNASGGFDESFPPAVEASAL
ncbi:hypothetical protein JCM10213_003542 [Rhodosporidiobolus nylandii]